MPARARRAARLGVGKDERLSYGSPVTMVVVRPKSAGSDSHPRHRCERIGEVGDLADSAEGGESDRDDGRDTDPFQSLHAALLAARTDPFRRRGRTIRSLTQGVFKGS